MDPKSSTKDTGIFSRDREITGSSLCFVGAVVYI